MINICYYQTTPCDGCELLMSDLCANDSVCYRLESDDVKKDRIERMNKENITAKEYYLKYVLFK